MHDVTEDDIRRAVDISGLKNYTGKYRELGGGEVNDTFVLDCGEEKVVLRISRYESSWMLVLESKSLQLLNIDGVPKLIFYDGQKLIKNRQWILESYVAGSPVNRLSVRQFYNLGALLSQVHKIVEPDASVINFWHDFLNVNKSFGDEAALLDHPDILMRKLLNNARDYLNVQTKLFEPIHNALTHGDLSQNNFLVNGDQVSIIDWEFSLFRDPMVDFSSIYYTDMEKNKGIWTVKITPEEKNALFTGYQSGGGTIDEKRIDVWILVDKLGSATYLYWKMHKSNHPIEPERLEQYKLDYDNLTESLSRSLLS